MGNFLNSKMPYEAYRKTTSGQYFVDKSAMLRELMPVIGTEERYICITRPRRFGLSAVVNLAYLAARDKYRVEREDKAGEGYVDFIFYPERKGMDAILLELKVDHTPEEAIRQIKDRKYVLRLKGRLGEREKVTGRILAVGISYDRKTKEHSCKVETMG